MKAWRAGGFTLIEVLVVIAIIGILASIVLVGVGNIRIKAQDVRVKNDMLQLRSLIEIYYDINNSSYAGVEKCFPTIVSMSGNCYGLDAAFDTIYDDIEEASGTNANWLRTDLLEGTGNGRQYCVAVLLASSNKSIPDKYMCIDYRGIAKVVDDQNPLTLPATPPCQSGFSVDCEF